MQKYSTQKQCTFSPDIITSQKVFNGKKVKEATSTLRVSDMSFVNENHNSPFFGHRLSTPKMHSSKSEERGLVYSSIQKGVKSKIVDKEETECTF